LSPFLAWANGKGRKLWDIVISPLQFIRWVASQVKCYWEHHWEHYGNTIIEKILPSFSPTPQAKKRVKIGVDFYTM
jgi:hypothetical protein